MSGKAITMWTVLEECLDYEQGLKRLCSRNYDGKDAMDGMEDVFEDQTEKCRILRELMQAVQNEKVREAIGSWRNEQLKDWQKKVLDGSGYTTRDLSPAEEPMRF